MNQELYLSNLISEMLEKHNCHSIILYGSRADNSHNEQSDIDIVCFTENSDSYTDCRLRDGIFLDAWIYPESYISNLEHFLKLINGKVLIQKDKFGEDLLEKVKELFERGSEKLSAKIDKQFKAAKKLGFADEQIVKFKPGVTETKGYFLIKSEERDTTDLGNKIIDKYKADNRFNFDLAKMTISGKHPDNGKIAIDKESDFAVFIVKGQGVFTVNGDTLSLSEGDAVYIRSGSTFLVEGEVEYITVCNPPFSLDQYSEIDI
jgi:mannose-6-phosphate isomerase-like protein (cupin superfamily)